MTGLGIVNGWGAVSEEVLMLAERLAPRPQIFSASPLTFLQGPWAGIFPLSYPRLNPLSFTSIARELDMRQIDKLLLIGDFPQHTKLLAFLLGKTSVPERHFDAMFREYFESTDEQMAFALRYLVSLDRFLYARPRRIAPVLIGDVFPQMSFSQGTHTSVQPPQSIIEQLPTVLRQLSSLLQITARERNRFSQSAIVDDNTVVQTEHAGTDHLIRSYGSRKLKQKYPFLLKPPSLEVNAAIDQPTIGPSTIELCATAGLKGVIVCERATIVANKVKTLELANHAKLFVYAVSFGMLAK